MNGTPTTRELKVKIDSMCESVDELKIDIKDGFASLKKDLAENYVRNETLNLSLKPLQEFQKTATGAMIGIGITTLVGIVGFLIGQAVLNFKI